MKPLLTSLILSLALPGSALAVASDAQGDAATSPRVEPAPQQTRMADLARQLAPDTEAVWLETNSDRTLTLYYPAARAKPYGGVILLPDERSNPDAPNDLHPLRLGLAEQGWDTLSVGLPTAPPAAAPARTLPPLQSFGSGAQPSTATSSPAAPPSPASNGTPGESYETRVLNICEAAIRHLESRQRDNIVILGAGTGARWAARCVSQYQDSHHLGLVMLWPRRPIGSGAPLLTKLLPSIKTGIVDLYRSSGSPLDPAARQARRRLDTARRNDLKDYHQAPLPPQSPSDGGTWLVREVRGQIDRNFKASEAALETKAKPAEEQPPGS